MPSTTTHRLFAVLLTLAAAACSPPGDPVPLTKSSTQPSTTPPAAPAVTPPPEPAQPVASAAAEEVPEMPPVATPPQVTPIANEFREIAARIVAAAQREGQSHDRLRHLCDVIGPRLSGSDGLAQAVEWTAKIARDDGLRVKVHKVMVPHWVRGRESATLLVPRTEPLEMLGLGNSVGTPPEGITASVVVAHDFDELASLGAQVRGKIVLFNRPMPPYDAEKGAGYGGTVAYRTSGPSRAAAAGAVACLVRSVTATSLGTPHTGMLRYDTDKPRIPAAALSIEDAEMLARLVAAGEPVRVRLHMEAHFEDDAESANVIADLVGREKPDEIVLISGHLDSWDVGQGAQDDGGACMAVLDALRLLKTLGLRPRRTIRCVLWTNEENGLRGSRDYVRDHAEEMQGYVAAIEADSGIFPPLGFGCTPPKDESGKRGARAERVMAQLTDLLTAFETWGADRLRDGGGGADIGAMSALGVPLLGLDVEGSRYFDVHHTHADTFDKVAKEDLLLCQGLLAATAYVLAEMEPRLGE